MHSDAHVDRIAATAGRRVRLDPDTATSPRSYEAARLAAGAAIVAAEAVLDGAIERAFCAVRPPGHHATRDEAMGFCLFNNVAAAAAAALARGLERVAVVDFDVHPPRQRHAGHLLERPPRAPLSSHQYPRSGTATWRSR